MWHISSTPVDGFFSTICDIPQFQRSDYKHYSIVSFVNILVLRDNLFFVIQVVKDIKKVPESSLKAYLYIFDKAESTKDENAHERRDGKDNGDKRQREGVLWCMYKTMRSLSGIICLVGFFDAHYSSFIWMTGCGLVRRMAPSVSCLRVAHSGCLTCR